MTTASASRPRSAPPDLQDHAIENIRYIRETMERAGSLTAFPGWGQVIIGGSALGAALMASRAATPEQWLLIWMAEAVLSIVIGAAAMARKAARSGVPFLNEAGRRFALSFSLPIVVGAVLTGVMFLGGLRSAIPGMWLLLYGTAIATGGAFSVKIVPVMGYCFMAAGLVALLPGMPADVVMAASFGGFHIVFGFVIARRYGG